MDQRAIDTLFHFPTGNELKKMKNGNFQGSFFHLMSLGWLSDMTVYTKHCNKSMYLIQRYKHKLLKNMHIYIIYSSK